MSRISKVMKNSMFLLLLSTGSVFAGDGADEVAMQIADLQKRLQDLEANAMDPKDYIQTFRKEKNFTVSLSGHLNRGMLALNNNKKSQLYHVDNDNSSSRLTLGGEGKVSDDVKLSTIIEFQLEDNSSSKMTLDQTKNDPNANARQNPEANNAITTRKMDMNFTHTKYGGIWMGKGDAASEGIAEANLDGTYVVTAASAIHALAGNVKMNQKDKTGSTATGPSISAVFDNFDGAGRPNRIKYVSPNMNGVVLQAGHISGDTVDGSVGFDGAVGDTKISAIMGAAKFKNNGPGLGYTTLAGSAAVLFGNGISGSVAVGKQKRAQKLRQDGSFFHTKLGYRQNFFDCGETKLAIDYGQFKHVGAVARTSADNIELDDKQNGTGKTYAIMAVQSLNKAGTELYSIYRRYKLTGVKNKNIGYDSVSAFLAGARVKF